MEDDAERVIGDTLWAHWPMAVNPFAQRPRDTPECWCGLKFKDTTKLKEHIVEQLIHALIEPATDDPAPREVLNVAADTVRRNREEGRQGPYTQGVERWLRAGAPLGQTLEEIAGVEMVRKRHGDTGVD